jgi:hypothetical protein
MTHNLITDVPSEFCSLSKRAEFRDWLKQLSLPEYLYKQLYWHWAKHVNCPLPWHEPDDSTD